MNIDENLSRLIEVGVDADLPAPDTATPMISRSLRISLDLDTKLRALAESRGIGATTLMREMLEAGVAQPAEHDRPVMVSDLAKLLNQLGRTA